MLQRLRAARAVAVAGVIAVACSVGGLPEDTKRLGDLRLAAASETEATITAERAIAAAFVAGHAGNGTPYAYLVAPAQPLPAPSGVFIGREIAWLLRWHGDFREAIPPSDDAAPPSFRHYSYLYVFVDAHSGSVLDAMYME
jgi:hypothetical protein